MQIKSVPLKKDFQPDMVGLASLGAKQAKILFLCSPNNPTGSVFNLDDIEKIVQDFPGIVVLDEAYIDFADIPSCISLVDQYPNLVVLQTFSKAWGMAGVRLGLAFAQAELIAWMNKIKMPYNINQLTPKRGAIEN